jgi:hypothetical protein
MSLTVSISSVQGNTCIVLPACLQAWNYLSKGYLKKHGRKLVVAGG